MSQADGYSKCICVHCGGRIEFPADAAGRSIDCPHCHWPITLAAAAAPYGEAPVGGRSAARKKILLASGITALTVIAVGAVALLYVSKEKENQNSGPIVVHPLDSNAPVSPGTSGPVANAPVHKKLPDPWHGLMAGPISIEKSEDGRLVYAVGTLTNVSDHERFAVKVELDVYDSGNEKVGTATDYTPSIVPGKHWAFKAMILDRTARRARLTSVKEN